MGPTLSDVIAALRPVYWTPLRGPLARAAHRAVITGHVECLCVLGGQVFFRLVEGA